MAYYKKKKEHFDVGEDIDEGTVAENIDMGMTPEKTLVLSTFLSLKKNSLVEFRGGFNNLTIMSDGTQRENYVPDTREVFCNTVWFLRLIIAPYFDEGAQKKDKDWISKLKDLKSNFLDSTSLEENQVLGESFYEEQHDKFLLEQYKNEKLLVFKSMAQYYWHYCIETGFFDVNNKVESISYTQDMTEEDLR